MLLCYKFILKTYSSSSSRHTASGHQSPKRKREGKGRERLSCYILRTRRRRTDERTNGRTDGRNRSLISVDDLIPGSSCMWGIALFVAPPKNMECFPPKKMMMMKKKKKKKKSEVSSYILKPNFFSLARSVFPDAFHPGCLKVTHFAHDFPSSSKKKILLQVASKFFSLVKSASSE